MLAERIARKREGVGKNLQLNLAQSLGFKVEQQNLEADLQAEEDDAIIDEIKEQNRRICCIFKKRIKPDLEDRIRYQMD